jgi:hypothetical protein
MEYTLENFAMESLPVFSFIFCLLISNAHAGYPASDLAGAEWKVLVEGETWVGCSQQTEITWCRSVAIIEAPQAKLSELLQSFETYPKTFKRVYKTKVLAPNVVHVLLDMPFPFKYRDYIAHFVETQEAADLVFTFNAVEHVDAVVPDQASVRLPRAAGRWRLTPVGTSQTKVTYTWNGELLGKIPTFGLPEAWSTQGVEVMEWLEEAVQ